MPTISTHVSEELADAVEKAANASPDKKVGPWLAKAASDRLQRDGFLPGSPKAEILAAAEALGDERALAALRREARKSRPVTAAA